MSERRDSILLVEDDPSYAQALSRILQRRFDVHLANSRTAADLLLQQRAFHGVLLDIRLGGDQSQDLDGIVLLSEMKRDRPLIPVIIMTSFGTVQLAVQAMKLGADDFVEKGDIEASSLAKLLQEALRRNREKLQLAAHAAELAERDTFDLVGNAKAMEPVRTAIQMAASDGQVSVLIGGESGTGKEVVARSVHQLGERRDKPFVAVATPALPEHLLESELFGHEKGAFTGAEKQKIGYVERADGGVLFLDEIGELALDLQVKLFRFLQERVINRVGSTISHGVDVQLVAATNQDLRELVEQGKFREELYYRLKTVEIIVPPLRDRKDDIPLLADHFLQILRRHGRTKLAGFSNEAMNCLENYRWRGNVRELQSVVEVSMLSAGHAKHWVVELEDLPGEVREPSVKSVRAPADETIEESFDVERARARAELHCVNNALERCGRRKSEAEQLLGYPNRHTMRRRIQQLRERYPDIWKDYPVLQQTYGAVDSAQS